jgi:hypothetical protein
MDPVAVVALALIVVGLAFAVWVRAEGPSLLPDFFRHPTLGWPHGVQEDDDARWSWRPKALDPSAPVIERVKGRVHAGRGD